MKAHLGKVIYPAVFYKYDNGDYAIEFPDLPGCFTCAYSEDEADYMAKDVLAGYIYSAYIDGDDIFVPTNVDIDFDSSAEENEGIVSYEIKYVVVENVAEYAKQHNFHEVGK